MALQRISLNVLQLQLIKHSAIKISQIISDCFYESDLVSLNDVCGILQMIHIDVLIQQHTMTVLCK